MQSSRVRSSQRTSLHKRQQLQLLRTETDKLLQGRTKEEVRSSLRNVGDMLASLICVQYVILSYTINEAELYSYYIQYEISSST
jgi:hypothetical protein